MKKEVKSKAVWRTLFSPLPKGTIVRCRDKRFKRGFVLGKILGYYQSKSINNPNEIEARRYFSYGLNIGERFLCWKSADTVVEIIGG